MASCCNLPQMPGLKTLSGIFNLGQRAEGALEDFDWCNSATHHFFLALAKHL